MNGLGHLDRRGEIHPVCVGERRTLPFFESVSSGGRYLFQGVLKIIEAYSQVAPFGCAVVRSKPDFVAVNFKVEMLLGAIRRRFAVNHGCLARGGDESGHDIFNLHKDSLAFDRADVIRDREQNSGPSSIELQLALDAAGLREAKNHHDVAPFDVNVSGAAKDRGLRMFKLMSQRNYERSGFCPESKT